MDTIKNLVLPIVIVLFFWSCWSPQTEEHIIAIKKPPVVGALTERFLVRFPELYKDAVLREASIESQIKRLLSEKQGLDERKKEKQQKLSYPIVLRAVYYQSAHLKLRFVTRRGLRVLNATGKRLLEELHAADRHVLDPEKYQLSRITYLVNSFNLQPIVPPATPSGKERAHIRRLVGLCSARAAWQQIEQKVMQQLISSRSLPRIKEAFIKDRAAYRQSAFIAAQVELLLADGLLGYARDLSRGNTRPAELVLQRLQQSATPASAPASSSAPRPWSTRELVKLPKDLRVLARSGKEAHIRQLFQRDLLSVHDLKSLKALLASLSPPFPQYRKLLEARKRYQQIVADGGWSAVRPLRRLRLGQRHKRIKALKTRLLRQGFYKGDLNGLTDQALIDAVRAFQRTHQLSDTGQPDRWFWKSLNISAQRRLQAIELTIKRWRESSIGNSSYYLFVNIPDYHLELWRQGKLLHRQPIVVGQSYHTKCDEETHTKILAYATPVQSAWLRKLVFCPYWNVTRSIKETELDPERGKDSLFYEKHGYEIMKPETKHEWVREMPGPANSLGFIKFLFPNPHETYLHGTPFMNLFQRPIRAFSHGCMRLQDPWKLAKLILTYDGQWKESHYQRLYLKWRSMRFTPLQKEWDQHLYEELKERAANLETVVHLKTSVPIHVEYYTVKVDDHGRIHFLTDIYRLDEERLFPRQARQCVPDSKLAKRGYGNMQAQVTALEQQALGLTPCLLLAVTVARTLNTNPTAKNKILHRKIKKLENFLEQHGNLARYIREEYEVLEKALEQRKRRWREALVKHAVRVKRLIAGLDTMTRKAKATCAIVSKLATTTP